jgi:hypothetical protein
MYEVAQSLFACVLIHRESFDPGTLENEKIPAFSIFPYLMFKENFVILSIWKMRKYLKVLTCLSVVHRDIAWFLEKKKIPARPYLFVLCSQNNLVDLAHYKIKKIPVDPGLKRSS